MKQQFSNSRWAPALVLTCALAALSGVCLAEGTQNSDDPKQGVKEAATSAGAAAHDAGEHAKEAGRDLGQAAREGYHAVSNGVHQGYETVKATAQNFWHSLKGD